MHRGDLLVGSFAKGQIGYNRPFAGAGQYRTPLPGLYLCGDSVFPGQGTIGVTLSSIPKERCPCLTNEADSGRWTRYVYVTVAPSPVP